jgi:hypothetical protein
MTLKTYAARRSDILGFILLAIIASIGFHAFISFSGRRNGRSEEERIADFLSPGWYLFSLMLSLIFFSPVWNFRRKYPKELSIDTENGKLTVRKRNKRKPLVLDKDNLSYFVSHAPLYSRLEIYYEFLSSRGIPVKKRVVDLTAPIALFSFNTATVLRIRKDLDDLGIPFVENKWRPKDEHFLD